MEENFLELFKEIIEFEGDKINYEDEFRSYDEWDSLTYLSLIAMLDDEYEVVIETEDFKLIRTVGQLIEEVKKRSSKQ